MKTIALDFDGVLHTSPENPFTQMPLLEQCLLPHLNKVEIVISSSWRFSHSITELRDMFPTTLRPLVVNVTGPAFIGSYARFMEISRYVKDYGVNDWIALDDSSWEFQKGCPQLVECNPRMGLQPAQVEIIEKWLKG